MTDDVTLINPPGLPAPIGFSHAATMAPGRVVVLAGQVAHDPDGDITATSMPDQFEIALRNLATALDAAGGSATDLAWLQIFTTDMAAYRAELQQIGRRYRDILGAHYPPMALVGVTELFEPAAKVEVTGLARLDR